jgi:FMN reductase (NADPH)
MYSAVVIQDAERKSQMAELCGGQRHIEEAPVFIAWCADLSRLDRMCKQRGCDHVYEYLENFMLASVDTAILMQTATIAAESLGLGMCYIGAIRNNAQGVIDLLDLPRLVVPVSGMTLGWPQKESTPRPRLPLDGIVHWEHYDEVKDADALAELDQAMIETGIYQVRQVPIPGQPEHVENYGWIEHSARRASTPHRMDLREVFEHQGFALK